MANGSSDNQGQQLTDDQATAVLRYINPNISQSAIDQLMKIPGKGLGGAAYGGYGTASQSYAGGAGHGQAGLGTVVGAQPVAPLVGLLQAFQPPPQQPQPQQQTQAGYTPDQIRSIVAQLTPSSTPTGQSASPTALQASAIPGGQQATAVPTTPVVTATNPTGSMYNLPQSFQAPQQYRSGGRVQGYQGGGQVTNPNQPSNPYQYQTSTDWFNPEFSLSLLGQAATNAGAYGTPTVINPMPNQGQMGKGSLVSSGVYSGPQQATVLGQGPGGAGAQSLAPTGPWTYQPGVLSGPAGSTTIGMSIPGAGSLSPQQSSQLFGLYNAAQAGNTGAQQAMQQWQQGMGMSNEQVNSMMQGYQNNLRGVYTQAYPGGAPSTSPLTATPWGTSATRAAAPTPFATAPMPGGQALPAPATGMPGIANFGGMQPPPAPTGPGMMAQGPPGVAPPTAFGGAYTGYTAGVPGVQPAQPAPYTGNVHNDPYISHAVSALLGMPSNPWHSPDGTPRGGAMPQGGGASDVAQAASMALATAPKGPLRAQTGGYVRGYQQGDYVQGNEPSEVRRGSLTVPQEGSSGSSQPSPAQAAQNGQTTINNLANRMSSVYGGGGNQPPAAPGGTGLGMGRGTFGPPTSAGGLDNVGIIGGGEEALANQAAGVGGGLSQQQGNALAGGIGAIGGAFQQALNKTAQTPWQWQPAGAWANPQNYRQAPPPQLQQEQVPQEQQGRSPVVSAATYPGYYGTPYGR